MRLTNYHAKYFARALTSRHSADSMGKLAGALVDTQVNLNNYKKSSFFPVRLRNKRGMIHRNRWGRGESNPPVLLPSQPWHLRPIFHMRCGMSCRIQPCPSNTLTTTTHNNINLSLCFMPFSLNGKTAISMAASTSTPSERLLASVDSKTDEKRLIITKYMSLQEIVKSK